MADTSTDKLSVFQIAGNGSLSQIPGSPVTAGDGPTAVAANQTGDRLYVTNQVSSNISSYQVAGDGSISAAPGSPLVLDGTSPLGRMIAVVDPQKLTGFRTKAKKSQKQKGKSVKVVVKAGADQAASLAGTGKVGKVKLKKAKGTAKAGKLGKLTLTAKGSAAEKILDALTKGKKPKAAITVKGTNAVSKTTKSKKVAVKLK